MNLRIGILTGCALEHDRRAYTEVKALVERGFHVELICNDDYEKIIEPVGYSVKPWVNKKVYDIKEINYAEGLADKLLKQNYDVIHCHNWTMLHVGAIMKQKQPSLILVYESRELFHAWPMNFNTNISQLTKLKTIMVRKREIFLEKRDAKKIDFLLTVNQSLADILTPYFQLKNKAYVTRNIPEIPEEKPQPTENLIRKQFNIADDKKILVFIGAHVYPQTLNLEQVIDEFANKPDVAMVFICMDDQGKRDVEQYAKSKKAENIFFHRFLLGEEINTYLRMCDVGLVPTWNKNDKSYWYALDNKLFEYMMAELPILTTQQPEYAQMIASHRIGFCVNPDEPGGYYQGFHYLYKYYDMVKTNLKAAKQKVNWQIEKQNLFEMYDEVIKKIAHQKAHTKH